MNIWQLQKTALEFLFLQTMSTENILVKTFSFFTRATLASAGISCRRVCLSVCLSVRLLQVGILLKQLNVGSHKQHHMIAQRLFLVSEISEKLKRGHPNGCAKCKWGRFN